MFLSYQTAINGQSSFLPTQKLDSSLTLTPTADRSGQLFPTPTTTFAMNPPPAIAIAPEGQKVLDKASLIVAQEYTRLLAYLVKRTTTFNHYNYVYKKNKLL
jgi:hypothetical protein